MTKRLQLLSTDRNKSVKCIDIVTSKDICPTLPSPTDAIQ